MPCAERPSRQHRCRSSDEHPYGAGCRESSANFPGSNSLAPVAAGFWRVSEAGDEVVRRLKVPALSRAFGGQFGLPRPVPDGAADGGDIHMQEEVAKGRIRRRALEFYAERLGQHSVVPTSETLQTPQALALAQDPEDRHQQQVPGWNPDAPPHPGIRDRLEEADQIEIGCGRNALEH